MKLWLVVLTQGKWEGKEIAVSLPQFLIGRDPGCHLRPASPLISKHHCAFLILGEQAFVRDFGSTNGTFLNDQPVVKQEAELHDQDIVRVGPIAFRVRLEPAQAPVDIPTPLPSLRSPELSAEDEAAATLLLTMPDPEGGATPAAGPVDQDGVPTGSTVLEALKPPSGTEAKEESAKGGAGRMQKAQTAAADTSVAAKAILEKYLRRPRS